MFSTGFHNAAGAGRKSRDMAAYIAFGALTICVFLPPSFVARPVRLSEMVILIGSVVASVHWSRQRLDQVNWLLPWLVIMYLFGSFLITMLNEADDLAWNQYQRQLFLGVTFLILGVAVALEGHESLARSIALLGCFQSVFAVYESLTNPSPLWYSPVPSDWGSDLLRLRSEIFDGYLRAQGTFGHPLFLSCFLLVAFAFTLRIRTWSIVTRVVVMLLLLAGMLAAGSRSSVLIALSLLAFYGLKQFSIFRGIACTFVLLVLGWALEVASTTVVQGFFESGSVSHRRNAVDSIPLIFSQDLGPLLLGNGWYSRGLLFSNGYMKTDGLYAVDNQFVSLLVTAGLVGVVLFLGIFILALRAAVGTVVAPALVAMFCMYFVIDVHDYALPWSLLCLLIGLASGSASREFGFEGTLSGSRVYGVARVSRLRG